MWLMLSPPRRKFPGQLLTMARRSELTRSSRGGSSHGSILSFGQRYGSPRATNLRDRNLAGVSGYHGAVIGQHCHQVDRLSRSNGLNDVLRCFGEGKVVANRFDNHLSRRYLGYHPVSETLKLD